MASYATSVNSAIQDDLTKTIDSAIATKNNFETDNYVRSLALETIRDLRQCWSVPSRFANGAPCADHDIVDKLHCVYTAAQRLHQHRYQPDGLPTKITSCFTKHIQSKRELTVRVIEEILKGALAVERTLAERVGAAEAAEEEVVGGNDETSAEPTGVTPSRPNNKRKGVFSVDDTEGRSSIMAASAVSKPQKKHKKVEDPSTVDTASTTATGEVASQDAPVNGTEVAVPSSTALETSSDTNRAVQSPAKSTQKVGPGNRNHEHSTKWYPDEEQFMRDFMTANVNWTFQQYSEANIARFKGTYYVDSTGVQQPGMREGRTSNAIRLRLGTFRSALKSGQRAQAGGCDTAGGDDTGDTAGGRARKTAKRSASPEGEAEPAALVIYASGSVVDSGESRAAGSRTEYNTLEPFDGGDIGEDEDPLGDLEEMASGVEAGEL